MTQVHGRQAVEVAAQHLEIGQCRDVELVEIVRVDAQTLEAGAVRQSGQCGGVHAAVFDAQVLESGQAP